MGSCQCQKQEIEDIDRYMKENHENQLKIDKTSYELAQQDFVNKNLTPQKDPSMSAFSSNHQKQLQYDDSINEESKVDKNILNEFNSLANLSPSSKRKIKNIGERPYNSSPVKKQHIWNLKEVQESVQLEIQTDVNHKMSESTLQRYLNMQEMKNKITPAVSLAALKKYLQVGIFDEDEQIIFQGELQKLKPGINFQYCTRWLQINLQKLMFPIEYVLQEGQLSAIRYITKLEPEIKKAQASALQLTMYRFELTLKEDFLAIYFDPYYDLCEEEENKGRLVISLQKKKQELSHYQDEMDYFTCAINPERMIEDYLGEINEQSKKKSSSRFECKNIHQPIQVQNDSQIDMTFIDCRVRQKNISKFGDSEEKKAPIVRSINKKKTVSIGNAKFNTYMSNREEKWFLMDKRLIFAHTDEAIFNEWVKCLSQMVPFQKCNSSNYLL